MGGTLQLSHVGGKMQLSHVVGGTLRFSRVADMMQLLLVEKRSTLKLSHVLVRRLRPYTGFAGRPILIKGRYLANTSAGS